MSAIGEAMQKSQTQEPAKPADENKGHEPKEGDTK
jgi:hypothetical protein